jgi:hypothetical protein
MPGGPIKNAGYTFHPKWGLVIAGGNDGVNRLTTVLQTSDAILFVNLPYLPGTSPTGKWERMSDMPTGRRMISCGSAPSSEGSPNEVVVAGGYDGYYTDVVEIFNVDTNT